MRLRANVREHRRRTPPHTPPAVALTCVVFIYGRARLCACERMRGRAVGRTRTAQMSEVNGQLNRERCRWAINGLFLLFFINARSSIAWQSEAFLEARLALDRFV
jgi:hypothetical protein